MKCQVALALKDASMTAAGGAGAVTVTTQPECAWSAASEASWITGVTPTSGQGSGEVQFQVAANSSVAPREGTLVLNGFRARVIQAGDPCVFLITPGSQDILAGGGNGSVTVTTGNGCSWTATSDSSWVSITSGSSGSGNGTVVYSVASNTGAARTASLAIGPQTFTISQSAVGVPGCQYALQPSSVSPSATGGTTPIAVQTTAGCAWTSSSQASWITFSGTSSGSGAGTVTINVAANGGGSRAGTVTIAGQVLNVTQAASAGPCVFSIQPTDVSVASTAGTTPINVQTGSSCAWTSTSQASWITFSGASGGTGNGTVTISTAAHTNAIGRTGTATIAGQTLNVTQAGCAVAINPASQTVTATGGAGTAVAVTSATGCSWTASTTATWITITSGTSGSGNGTVNFTAAANTGAQRVGTITIGSQTHTVTQSAAPSTCSFSISPTSVSVGKNASSNRTVGVTTTVTCGWTAASNASWLTITNGFSGLGNGTVRYDIARNDTGDDRMGTMTIAGRTFTVNQDKQ